MPSSKLWVIAVFPRFFLISKLKFGIKGGEMNKGSDQIHSWVPPCTIQGKNTEYQSLLMEWNQKGVTQIDTWPDFRSWLQLKPAMELLTSHHADSNTCLWTLLLQPCKPNLYNFSQLPLPTLYIDSSTPGVWSYCNSQSWSQVLQQHKRSHSGLRKLMNLTRSIYAGRAEHMSWSTLQWTIMSRTSIHQGYLELLDSCISPTLSISTASTFAQNLFVRNFNQV